MSLSTLVIGAGPVGLTMASELARYGVPVRIIDKSASRTDKSKALVLWSRSMELIDRMGCASAFVEAGFRVDAVSITAGRERIAHVRLDTSETPYPYALMLPQSETERLMEHHLESLGVKVERQVELIRFTAGTDHVSATLRHADGREEDIETGWMVGCDGAHSTVRHGLGMQFEGTTLPSNWILADVHLDGVASPPDELAMYWHSDGVLALFPITPGRYRIIADVPPAAGVAPGTPQPDPSLADVQSVLDRRGPGGIRVSEPIWLAHFVINERKVADYRAGRVFLAGDAAHIHSPAGGQGMNTGMQDAFNLAWKLALVDRGLAHPEPLLDSYSIERSEVGREVLSNAGHLTALAMMRGSLMQGLRNHVASLVFGLRPVQQAMTDTLSELSIGYAKGPITAGHGRHGGPAPGSRVSVTAAGNPIGAGAKPLFALFAPASAESAALIRRYAKVMEPQPRAALGDHGIWLVRPDGYVAIAAAEGAWDELNVYLEKVIGSP